MASIENVDFNFINSQQLIKKKSKKQSKKKCKDLPISRCSACNNYFTKCQCSKNMYYYYCKIIKIILIIILSVIIYKLLYNRFGKSKDSFRLVRKY